MATVASGTGTYRPKLRYTKRGMSELWIMAGGPPVLAPIMGHIGFSESSGNPKAVSSVGALGLWQIHPPVAGAEDPLRNAQLAVGKWRTQGLAAWTNYNATAKRLVDQAGFPTGPGQLPTGASAGTQPAFLGLEAIGPELFEKGKDFLFGDDGGGGIIPDNPLNALAGLLEPIENIVKLLYGFVEAWLAFIGKILSPSTWFNIGKMILGAWLLFIGLRRIVEVQVA